jgi:acyl-coenzyme A synthetase/AMP-(fatty) acid ligase
MDERPADMLDVEEVLLRHAGICEAVVIAVPDGAGGKTIKAVVVPARGARLSEAEVLAFAASQLPPSQKPRAVEFVAELPGDLSPRGGTAPPAGGST